MVVPSTLSNTVPNRDRSPTFSTDRARSNPTTAGLPNPRRSRTNRSSSDSTDGSTTQAVKVGATRTGSFGETVGNAAEALGTYRSARSEAKQKGALGLAELEYKYAADQDAATQKQGLEAMKLLSKMQGGGSLNANEKLRLGYALRLYPEKTREQIISEGLLYSGAVDARVNALPTEVAATNSGTELEVVVPDAPVSKTLQQAREAIKAGANRVEVLRRLERLRIPTDGL